MTKKGQNVSQVSHKRRLAVLVSSARCDREEIGTLSCHIRRCTAASMAQGLMEAHFPA